MKKINAYLVSIIMLFSMQTASIIAMQEQNEPRKEIVIQSTGSWFSYFTAPLISLANNISNTFSVIKNYFFPVAIQKPEKQSIARNESQLQETQPVKQKEKPLPEEVEIVAEKEKPISIKQNVENVAAPQLPLLGVSYNCEKKRLGLLFKNTQPRFFRPIDTYNYSPNKNYILASTIKTTGGVIKNISTKLINSLTNNKEITTFNDIKMYDFSPKETKLLFLTSDTSILQNIALQTPVGTFGTAKPSTKHEESTGRLLKTDAILAYHIFDLNTQKIINSFENATGVFFNNENEITVYFEDEAIEVHKLNTSIVTKLTKNIFSPTTQQSQELYRYFPHENKLKLPLTNPQATFPDIDKFNFSPQKKYILLEQNPKSLKALNLLKGINPNLPLIKLVNMQTGKAISNFGTPNMLMNDTTNIITYEFSPQETKILLQTRGQYGCKYILFDIEQNSIIDQPIASAQSVHFKNENEFTIITAQGETEDIPINAHQQTIKGKLTQQIANVLGPENIQTITDFTSQLSAGFSKLAKRTTKQKKQTEKNKKTIPFSELEPEMQKFLQSLPEESKSEEEEFFDSVMEQSMYNFKKYATTDKRKAHNAITDIITELSTIEEDDDDKQSIIIEKYRNYSPELQKKFLDELFNQYQNCTQEIKEKIIATLFNSPQGILYKPKEKEKNEIKNEANTVTATIKTGKIDNKNQDVLIFSSNEPIGLLSTHIIKKHIRAMLFNPSGKLFAVSYEKQPDDIVAPLDIFIQNKNETFGQYKANNFSINNSPEIIGLLFLDEATLLLVDEKYTISSIVISDTTKKFLEALTLLKTIETDCLKLQNTDVNSPATLSDIDDKILRLDYITEQLSAKQKTIINGKQNVLYDTYGLTFTAIFKNGLMLGWQKHKETLKQIAMSLVKPALSIATLHILQATTGNVSLDLESLKIAIMSGIAAAFTMEYSKYIINPSLSSLVIGGGSAAITEYFDSYNKTVSMPIPKPLGMIRGAITTIIATKVQSIIAQEGGIPTLMQEYSQNFLLREKKPLPEPENEITSLLVSTIKNKINNDQIISLLAEISYVTIESACIGMGLYLAGLGFANEKSLTEALYCNALRGVVQGTINYGFTATSNKTGAIITIPTAMISASIVSDLTHKTFTPESAISSLIQATTQAVTDVIVNDPKRLSNILSTTKQKIEQSIQNNWSKAYDLFSAFKENLFTIEEIKEENIAYGSV